MNSENFIKKSNVKVLFDSMIEVTEIMDSFNIISFLNFGALLGYVRERALLPWNNDVELCTYSNDNFKKKIKSLMDILQTKGYDVLFHEYAGTLSVKKKDVDININLIWKKKDKFIRPHDTAAKRSTSNFVSFYLYWLASYMFVYKPKSKLNSKSTSNYFKTLYINIFQKIPFSIKYRMYKSLIGISKIFGAKYLSTSFPYTFFSELKTVDFNGFNVRIPLRSVKVLNYLYGYQWNIPKENWSFYDKKNKNETNIIFIEEKILVSDWKIIS